ncbi:FGGY-family carbohydrate kinase [Luteipulveratus mongoliensis]|uniref:Sugar kinase n=1 Tax=Luteipulveratus mongoliensis TaxID=571913 RepID=A0A0K1JIV6_9MICO|nr:FGGY-family carbohydrate kinase [Luteipulveratus mongoliensis]AKU16515.1 sugar kinase [Luteipulveratus mongoliensis]
MPSTAVLGVDIGTSSSKGVLVGMDGRVLRSAQREHPVQRPRAGWVEMDGEVWWDEFVSIARELVDDDAPPVVAVGVSGMGPCVLLADEHDVPVRPAILYGVDTRAGAQIERLDRELGSAEIMRRCGSALSSQAAGAKVAWVAETEPDAYARARRLYMPSSWLARHLTGAYVLDHHSASQCTPLYDVDDQAWIEPWWDDIAGDLEQPPLQWANDVAGQVTADAAASTGLPQGIPVITGTIDAWSEALSVGAHGVGDLMLMYGTTMFLVNTVAERVTQESLWGPVGALAGTRSLAGGMATTGAVTGWLREIFGSPSYPDLLREAQDSGAGAKGLLMLPYFAGERTPIMDPDARGVIAGLTVSHTRGDLYRAALEATGFGVRHNIETMVEAGGDIRRVVAVGGGTQGDLWPQVVSDITGREQVIPSQTIGASYGAALLAAQSVGDADIATWNPPVGRCTPNPAHAETYDLAYHQYRELYAGSASVVHALADAQRTGDDAKNVANKQDSTHEGATS